MRPKIGYWATICCAEDLRQIKDNEDLNYCLKYADEIGYRFWRTREDALRELQPSTVTE